MKSCCRGCYGTLYLGIDSLVCRLVTFLCLAVKIWRYRKLADGIQDLRKTYLVGIPIEVNPEVCASGDFCVLRVVATDGEDKLMAVDVKLAMQRTFLPFLEVTNHAPPRAVATCLEYLLIVNGESGLHQEYLYQCASLLPEVHTRLYHFGIIEYHQRTSRQMVGQMIENIFRHYAVFIQE